MDGSESRGALAAGFQVEYGSLRGATEVTVWMPEIPVKVSLEDTRLSQIKGWKVKKSAGSKIMMAGGGSGASATGRKSSSK